MSSSLYLGSGLDIRPPRVLLWNFQQVSPVSSVFLALKPYHEWSQLFCSTHHETKLIIAFRCLHSNYITTFQLLLLSPLIETIFNQRSIKLLTFQQITRTRNRRFQSSRHQSLLRRSKSKVHLHARGVAAVYIHCFLHKFLQVQTLST